MANAYTLQQVKSSIPSKAWVELSLDMQKSAKAYLDDQTLTWYYLIVPSSKVAECAALTSGRRHQLIPVTLTMGDRVLPLDTVTDRDTYGYAYAFLSGLKIRLVDKSEFTGSDPLIDISIKL